MLTCFGDVVKWIERRLAVLEVLGSNPVHSEQFLIVVDRTQLTAKNTNEEYLSSCSRHYMRYLSISLISSNLQRN